MEYTLNRSKRARRISITINHSGDVTLTIPERSSEFLARVFLNKRISWIEQTQKRIRKRFKDKIILDQSAKNFKTNKKIALEFVKNKVQKFNAFYNFKYGEIRVRNQKSRWGSCARNGNLSFNYGLIKVPVELADYVVVHELCHLKEFNHSQKFWDLVALAIPDYKTRRKQLKKNYITIK